MLSKYIFILIRSYCFGYLKRMDKGAYSKVFMEAKRRLDHENEIFMLALDKRAEEEIKFRSAIDCLSKMTDSAIEVVKLREKYESDQTDAQTIVNVKKDLKFTADCKFSLAKEMILSRKRSQKLDEVSHGMKRMFGIESPAPPIVEIPDSPPRLVDDSDRGNDQQLAKVSLFHMKEQFNDLKWKIGR